MSISESPESPLVKSWDLKFQLAMEAIKSFEELSKLPIEQAQELFIQSTKIKVPSNIIVKKVTLDERYRQKSRNHLEKGLKQFEDVIDEKWKEPNDRLYGEWVYAKEEEEIRNNEMDKVVLHMHGGAYYLGSAKSSRSFTIKFAVQAKTRVFSIDYRLSPPNQFPAPLCDCLAAYLYLITPGPDAGFKPINPKKIVIAGESAGAGLAFSMLLFLRDAGMPLPGGAIGLSPWVDLTHSMPSFWDDLVDKVDILPKILGGRKIWPSSPAADEYIANVKALSNKIAQKKPTIVGHPSFTKVPRFQFYCANEALAIPYASPMLAESLGDLPPILFMFSFSKSCKVAFERCCDFIKRVTSVEDNNTSMIDLLKEDVVSPSILISPSLVAMRVSINGETKELNEADRNCLKYSKIGIVPKEAALASKL
ncbi:20105_t:CDS:2 [Gigaspora margarita]|uniref:20105_t:CDS:1 n=1 Tax=Gigaspora margarita TaxID=4874 RepID=A0ABN7UPD6_GIGMA|nr:20105_t:CDS:2 [Gigaspora margarita]